MKRIKRKENRRFQEKPLRLYATGQGNLNSVGDHPYTYQLPLWFIFSCFVLTENKK